MGKILFPGEGKNEVVKKGVVLTTQWAVFRANQHGAQFGLSLTNQTPHPQLTLNHRNEP